MPVSLPTRQVLKVLHGFVGFLCLPGMGRQSPQDSEAMPSPELSRFGRAVQGDLVLSVARGPRSPPAIAFKRDQLAKRKRKKLNKRDPAKAADLPGLAAAGESIISGNQVA